MKSVIQAPIEDKPSIKSTSEFSVVVVDGMAELQAIAKPPTVRTCENLGNALMNPHSRGSLL